MAPENNYGMVYNLPKLIPLMSHQEHPNPIEFTSELIIPESRVEFVSESIINESERDIGKDIEKDWTEDIGMDQTVQPTQQDVHLITAISKAFGQSPLIPRQKESPTLRQIFNINLPICMNLRFKLFGYGLTPPIFIPNPIPYHYHLSTREMRLKKDRKMKEIWLILWVGWRR